MNHVSDPRNVLSLAEADDRSAVANRTADHLGVHFYKKHMSEQALADSFEDATWLDEQPNPDLNFIGLYALSELVREEGFRVILNGTLGRLSLSRESHAHDSCVLFQARAPMRSLLAIQSSWPTIFMNLTMPFQYQIYRSLRAKLNSS